METFTSGSVRSLGCNALAYSTEKVFRHGQPGTAQAQGTGRRKSEAEAYVCGISAG